MCGYGYLQSVTNAEAGKVWKYIHAAKAGVIGGTPVSTFPATRLGSTSGTTRDITITNYRADSVSVTLSTGSPSDFSGRKSAITSSTISSWRGADELM